LQSRYYGPETGRFLNADDVDFIGVSGTDSGYNAFAYCENDAVNNNDLRGYFKGEYHNSSTVKIAMNMKKSIFNKYVAELLGASCELVDEIYSPVNKFYDEFCQSFHFNVYLSRNPKAKKDSRDDRAKELFEEGVECLDAAKKYKNLYKKNRDKKYNQYMKTNLKAAIVCFGMSLHPIQDKVAHSGKGGDFGIILNYGSKPVFVRLHLLWGIDNPEGKYLDTGKLKSEINKDRTEAWLLKITNAIRQRGLENDVKKFIINESL